MQSDKLDLPGGLRVLLAEDEPLIAMNGEAILLGAGVHEVVHARNVAEGLHAIGAGPLHAAFLDLRLGDETSLPLAKRLGELGLPFAFLTGYQGDAIPDEFKARAVIVKPYTADQLAQMLHSLVGSR